MKNLLLLFIGLLVTASAVAQLSISLPTPGVYQSTGTNTSVILAGQYIGYPTSNYTIKYNIVRLNVSDGSYNSYYQMTYTNIVTNPTYGLFRTTLSLPIGWYQVALLVIDNNTNNQLASNTVKFGIGDVYVIAGQSNAQGGSSSLPSLSTYDGIVSHNTTNACNNNLPAFPVMTALGGSNTISPSGVNPWCWQYLGQQLQSGAPTGGLPIAFFNTAQGGSSSTNWKESSQGSNSTSLYTGMTWCANEGYSGTPQPYFNFKTTLQYYSSVYGVKAVLWHQGEADNDGSKGSVTSQSTYRSNLSTVISQSRSDFSSSLRWLISQASFLGGNNTLSPAQSVTNSNVVAAQEDLVSNSSYNSPYNYYGSFTDGYGLSYRDTGDLVHFREDRSSGVSTLGGLWNSKINSASTGPIGAITPPAITMSKSGGTWTLTCPSGYSEYRWINMATANTNSAVGTSTTYSGTSGGSYACLVKNSSGKWAISQTIYTGCGSCREGALSDWSETDEGIQTKAYPVPFDKQLTIEFSIPYDSRVRLEIINELGQPIKQLTDNMHAKGSYTYPVTLEGGLSGMLFYRLNVNGLGITKKLIKLQ